VHLPTPDNSSSFGELIAASCDNDLANQLCQITAHSSIRYVAYSNQKKKMRTPGEKGTTGSGLIFGVAGGRL